MMCALAVASSILPPAGSTSLGDVVKTSCRAKSRGLCSDSVSEEIGIEGVGNESYNLLSWYRCWYHRHLCGSAVTMNRVLEFSSGLTFPSA